MQVEQLFRQASEHFQESEYSAGLELMSQCIAISPNNSALYSNRALFYSQLGQLELALHDLNAAITHNYLNYVAYFNLFSLQFNAGETELAFDNLCCSLSCLYLVRARKARRELDVQRSIKYAENNPDAHILKALMYLDDGKNKLALNQIQWALDLGLYRSLCLKIKHIINRRLNPYSVSEIQDYSPPEQGFRLHTTYEPTAGWQEQVKERVREFNEIYDQLVNAEYGTVTQKVQRIRLEDPSNANRSRSKMISQLSDIYEIKYKENSTNHQSKEKASEAPTKEQLTVDNNDSDLLERHVVQTSLENINTPKENDKEEENLLQDDSLDQIEQEFVKEEPVEQQDEDNLLVDESLETKVVSRDKINLVPFNSSSKQDLSPSPVASVASSSSESVSLYPIGNKKKIQFTIISAQVKNPGKLKDFYLTGNYNSRKGQRLKTPNKKIEGNSIKWFTAIAPTPISENMQTVSAKLFSKQYFSYDDELIGEGEVEIIRSGELKFPLYFKNKVTAFVCLRVDLI